MGAFGGGAGGLYALPMDVARVDALLARPLESVLPEAERVRVDVDELETLRACAGGAAARAALGTEGGSNTS